MAVDPWEGVGEVAPDKTEVDPFDSVMDELDAVDKKNTENLINKVGEVDQFSAWDSLEATSMQSQELDEVGAEVPFDVLVKNNVESAKAGTLGKTLTDLRSNLNSKMALEAEQMLVGEVEDIVTGKKGLGPETEQEILNLKDVIANIPIHKLIDTGGVIDASTHVSDFFFDSVELGKMNKTQREEAKFSALYMTLLSKGMDKGQIEEAFRQLHGLEQPLLSPVDLLIDIATGAVLAKGVVVAGKSLVSASGKGLAKTVGREVLFGQLAGGFMSIADAMEGGTFTTLASGLLGPSATAGLFLASRKGLAKFLATLSDTNQPMYRDLKKIATDTIDTVPGKNIAEIMRQLEAGELRLGKEPVEFLGESPAALAARNAAINSDEQATGALTGIALRALTGEGTQSGEVASKALGTGPVAHLSLIPTKKFAEEAVRLEGHEDLATHLRNTFKIKDTVAHHFFNDVATAEDKLFPDMVRATVNLDRNSIQLGHMLDTAEEKFLTGKMGVGKRVFQPSTYLGDLSDLAVKIPSSMESFSKNMIVQGQKILDTQVFNNLSKAETNQLDEVFRLSTDLEETLSVVSGGLRSAKTGTFVPATDKIIAKYYKGRFLMDSFYDTANQVALATAAQQGFKQLDEGFVVKPFARAKKGSDLTFGTTDVDGLAWTKELQAKGYVALQIVDPSNLKAPKKFKFLTEGEAANRVKDLDGSLAIVPRLEGYSPFRIKAEEKKFFVTKVVKDPDTGEYAASKVAAARNYSEGADVADKLTKADPSANYFAHRTNDNPEVLDVAMSKTFASNLRKLSEEELISLAKGMRAAGVEEGEVEAITRYAKTFGFNKKQPFKKRGSERLRSAKSLAAALEETEGDIPRAIAVAEEVPLEPTQAAMAHYIESVSKFINLGAWNDKAKSAFMKKYGAALGLNEWTDTIDFAKYVNSTARVRDLASEAVEVQAQLKRATGIPTNKELEVKSTWENRADKWYATDKHKFVGTLIDEHLSKLNRFATAKELKKIGAVNKLGMMNLGQFVVQQTALLNSFKYAFVDPSIIKGAVQDFNAAYLQAMVGKKFGLPVSKEAENLLGLIERAGINTGMNIEYADKVMTQLSGWKGTLKNIPGSVIKAGFLPLQAGEGVGRGLTWFAERQALISEIKKGTAKGFTVKDIDSDGFLNAVNIRTNITAGDFSKYNKAFVSREGVVSAMTQFWQFPIFQLDYMNPFSKSKSLKEKAGVWAAWVGAFGINGVPAFWDNVGIGEIIAEQSGHPEAVGATKRYLVETVKDEMTKVGASKRLTSFMQRLVTDGVISAGTGGEINFATRAGTSHIATNFIDGLSYSDLRGPGLNTLIGLVNGSVQTTEQLIELWKSDEFNRPAVTEALAEGAFKEITGPKNVLKATMPEINGREDPDILDRFQQFVGIKPGIDVELQQRRWDAARYGKAMRDFSYNEATRIVGMMENSPNYATKELEKVVTFLAEKNPMELANFQRAIINAWKAEAMPPELRVEYMEMMKNLDPTIYPE